MWNNKLTLWEIGIFILIVISLIGTFYIFQNTSSDSRFCWAAETSIEKNNIGAIANNDCVAYEEINDQSSYVKGSFNIWLTKTLYTCIVDIYTDVDTYCLLLGDLPWVWESIDESIEELFPNTWENKLNY